MTTICQLARKDKKYTHKPTIQHIHLMYSKVTAIFNTYTHKQTYICSTIIINHMTTTSQNNNFEQFIFNTIIFTQCTLCTNQHSSQHPTKYQ